MRYLMAALLLFSVIGMSFMTGEKHTAYSEATLQQFKSNSAAFAIATDELKKAASAIEQGNPASITNARKAFIECRLRYKCIEYFMEYFFKYPVNLYNRAPVYEVEEPYMEYQSPVGLQVIEGLLSEPDVYNNKKELVDQCDVIRSSANDIKGTLYEFTLTDEQVLESIRLELVRIITLGITGYDAPLIKTGITESAVALAAIQQNLEPLLMAKPCDEADSVNFYLKRSISLLQAHTNFDDFDRLSFLTKAALPLQRYFGAFVKVNNLDLNTYKVLNHDAPHIFSRDAIDISAFSKEGNGDKQQLADIGKLLFVDKKLSGNNSRSCATCHTPDKYFTDGLVKSRAFDNKADLTRNTPGLLYTAYQHMQFQDGRAGSLQEQIAIVLQSPQEMHADLDKVTAYINNDVRYKQLFSKAYSNNDKIKIEQVADALAAYEQTLAPFSSPFDKYIAGDALAMSPLQIKGFNLFMGKAQCGTCHFAPVFNALLPPYYEVSELEVLGVPQNNSKRHSKADIDSGRYHFFPISFNNGAFKTTTVRNSAQTAPYMHNGVYTTLDEVINFYNKGGGKGIGLKIETQTLSDKPLKLSKAEVKELKSFLLALTDDIRTLNQ